MKSLPDPERFDDTKMSFGEHLDELRNALWKAVIAVAIGFLVGLLFGDRFVHFVKAPLEAALEDLEQESKQKAFKNENGDLSSGEQRLINEGLVPEPYQIPADSFADALGQLGVEAPAVEKDAEPIELWLWTKPRDGQLISTGTPDVFSVYVKASLVIGIVLASPAVFYFIWTFVAAGLYKHEKRYIHIFLPFSIGLFLFGAIVAFYIVLQFVLSFLLSFNAWLDIDPTPRINEWLGFVLILPVMFGVAFQLPLVMLFLERIGVTSAQMYLSYWKYAVMAIFIISMILTPADPQSLFAMAGCLTPLYFGGIALCKFLPKPKAAGATA
ncbi:MAG: twin-arginine translocase subunit TatC [Planctomycetota bacterium]